MPTLCIKKGDLIEIALSANSETRDYSSLSICSERLAVIFHKDQYISFCMELRELLNQ